MLTPQEVQEKTFPKALRGYDMPSVDDFLEPLAQDYATLYQENEVLKEKLRVLVKKLEEYHDREEEVKAVAAKCAKMMQETPTQNPDVAQEEERLSLAKQAAAHFIEAVEKDVKAHLELLETLKTRDLGEKETRKKPYDYESEAPAESEPEKPKEEAYPMADRPTIKFDNLQFGSNYDPTKE